MDIRLSRRLNTGEGTPKDFEIVTMQYPSPLWPAQLDHLRLDSDAPGELAQSLGQKLHAELTTR